jgi:ABC-2 type transport system ATP-binding protein
MNSKTDADAVISVRDLSRCYGPKQALNQVTLTVPRGVVVGLVGVNGAGKTTLIKHVLGLLRAREGSVRVFGLDPVAHPVEVLGRLGYLSEDRDLPPWMTVGQLMSYSRGFYPRWDAEYAERLRLEFQLRVESRIQTLSKGELAKAGLLTALAHRPDLLVLDEPSSGLDPIVRCELLEAVVRSVADEGRTVLFSSHLLDEIARVSDQVAMLVEGRLVLQGPLHEILETHRRLVVKWLGPPLPLQQAPGVLSVVGGPDEWTVIHHGPPEKLREALRPVGVEIWEETPATFDEVFHARAAGRSALASAIQTQ